MSTDIMEDGGGKRISNPSAQLLGLCLRSRISNPALDPHWRITRRISALLVRLSSRRNAHSVVFFSLRTSITTICRGSASSTMGRRRAAIGRAGGGEGRRARPSVWLTLSSCSHVLRGRALLSQGCSYLVRLIVVICDFQ